MSKKITTYGPGGHDPDAPNDNVVSETDYAPPLHDVNRDQIDQAITDALARLQQLVDAPAVPELPAGTMTTAVLSNALRQMRDAVQANRAGAQEVALTLKRVIRLVRGDFDDVD